MGPDLPVSTVLSGGRVGAPRSSQQGGQAARAGPTGPENVLVFLEEEPGCWGLSWVLPLDPQAWV